MLLPLEEVPYLFPQTGTHPPKYQKKSIALEHNRVISARTRTQTTGSGVHRAHQKITVLPLVLHREVVRGIYYETTFLQIYLSKTRKRAEKPAT